MAAGWESGADKLGPRQGRDAHMFGEGLSLAGQLGCQPNAPLRRYTHHLSFGCWHAACWLPRACRSSHHIKIKSKSHAALVQASVVILPAGAYAASASSDGLQQLLSPPPRMPPRVLLPPPLAYSEGEGDQALAGQGVRVA